MPEKKPLVSIGMPLYNEERYLRQMLDSLISQDYDNFELIISDNASFDSTCQICQEYAAKDDRVRYHRNETNIGASANFKRVFKLSQGDYFAWVAGHDLWHSTFLSRCLEIFLQDESVVLCHPQALWIDTGGQPLGSIPSSVETRGLDQISRFNVVLWGLGYCYPIYGLISSKALRQAGLGLEVIGFDAILLAELSLMGAFAHISEPLLYMRKMEDYGSWDKYVEKIFRQSLSNLSASSMYWQMIDEHFKVVSKHINSSLEKDAATLSTVLCLLTKYSWVLKTIPNSKAQLPYSADDFEERIKQIGSEIYEATRAIEILFNKSEQSNDRQKGIPKIIVDGVFFQLYKTGIARVWKSLLEEWGESGFAKHIVVLDRAGTAPKISGIWYRNVPPYDYESTDTDREMLQQVCEEEGANLFISTYYTTPLSTPSIFMGYDMIPEVVGANLNEPMWKEKHHAIRHASAYIAISENTASDLAKFFPEIASKSVSVAQCGVHSLFSPASQEDIKGFKNKYGISKPYFISVGGGADYKNSILFFKAFAQLASKQGFEIVCTGSGVLLEGELRNYTLGTVVHKLLLNDEELRLAYAGAVALVYPSKYEGFGLPVLEALSCGCPVITCPNASIPEVAGEAALYVNDEDVEGLADALCEVQKLKVRNSLIAAGLEQAKKFSWSKMARTVSSALMDATLVRLNLKEINLIVFPDWSQPEEFLGLQLERVVRAIATHRDKSKMTLLVDNSNIADEDANLALSSVAINLLMEEDLDVSDGPEISLIGQLSELQWSALISRLYSRIVLENDNREAIAHAKAENIPSLELDCFMKDSD
ncbi:glycosyltransferase [Microcoleus sp. S13C4]|uniref:glycosyltransferase n=1 Tax=Microcoleus sp. S13C4 TaxID=3055410 RepID=UPI002FCEA0AB